MSGSGRGFRGSAEGFSPWFLVGNGGMDPYDRPLRPPKSSPKKPIPPFPAKNQSDNYPKPYRSL